MMNDEQRGRWLARRAGKLTASRMSTAMKYLKGGEPSKERSDYMRELLAERIATESAWHFVSDAMIWGLEKEDEAKMAYETATGDLITDCCDLDPEGVFDHATIANFAASPDGLLGHDGLIETKCPTTTTFVGWRLVGIVPPEHEPQMAAQLVCTRRRYCMFVAFDPRIRDVTQQIFIRRYEPTAAYRAKIEAEADKFLGELDELFDRFVTVPA